MSPGPLVNRGGGWVSVFFFRPDSYSYNSAIAACGPGGGANDARALLEVGWLMVDAS